MPTFDDLVGPNWPPSPDCNGLSTLITALTNIATELTSQTASTIIQPGDLKFHSGVTPIHPADGWLLCDGQAVSRTTYSALFAIIGTQYGIGDGSTTFTLPDARGRALIARDNMGGISADVMTNSQADVIGGTGGAEFHTLTIAEMPAHNHNGIQGVLPGTSGTARLDWAATAQSAAYLSNEGGDSPHPNDQPWLALDVYIKT